MRMKIARWGLTRKFPNVQTIPVHSVALKDTARIMKNLVASAEIFTGMSLLDSPSFSTPQGK